MSRSIELQNKAQAQKYEKRSQASFKEEPKPKVEPNIKELNKKFGLLIGFVFLCLIGLSFVPLLKLKNESLKRDYTFTELKDNIRILHGYIVEIDSKIKNQNEKFKLLDDDSDAKKVAIENLIKAKNTLLKRVNSLEIEIDSLKNKEASNTTQ